MKDFRDLLTGGEHQHVDLKGPMAFGGDDRLELAKDIIAMGNTRDGGTIVVGVSEDHGTGTWRLDGVTVQQAQTFEVTKVHDFVKQRAAPPVRIATETVEHDGKLFVLIKVSEFDDQPHICTKEGQTSTNKTVFRCGDVLRRTEGATSERISDESAMRQLLGRAVQCRADSLIRDISRMMRGVPASEGPAPTIWDTCRKLATNYSPRQKKYEHLGSWTFILYPENPLVLGSDGDAYQALRAAWRNAAVEVRGWDFPHINAPNNRRDSEHSLSYLEDSTDWQDCVESTVVFENGFFRNERVMREDLEAQSARGLPNPSEPGTYLDWLGSLYLVGEFAAFSGRLFNAIMYEGRVNYEVSLDSTAQRRLTTRSPGRELFPHRECAEPKIRIEGSIDTALLKADPSSFAIDVIKDIFALFHWEDPSVPMLANDLSKLYTRRL